MSLLVSILLATPMATPGGLTPDKVDHSPLDRILRETVRNERVDYLSIRRDHYQDLNSYLEGLAKIDPSKLPKMARLATLINLYNATMIKAVVERFHDGYSPADEEYAVFNAPLVHFGGEHFSLNALENEHIRPQFQEPRIHVALVCGALSCPPLIAKAYRAEGLRDALEDNMFRFVRNPRRNPIDAGKKKAVLSKIFEWYADDFGGSDKVLAYVDRYAKEDLADFTLAHAKYDWSLNLAAPKGGRWIVQTTAAALTGSPVGTPLGHQAHKGEVYEVLEEDSGWLRIDRALGRGEAWVKATTTAPWQPTG